jgi:hypothetical protein
LSLGSLGHMGNSAGSGYRQHSGYGPGRYQDPGPNRRKRMESRRQEPYSKVRVLLHGLTSHTGVVKVFILLTFIIPEYLTAVSKSMFLVPWVRCDGMQTPFCASYMLIWCSEVSDLPSLFVLMAHGTQHIIILLSPKCKQFSKCRIWGSHSGGYEEYGLLGYNAM